jgi:hypothetical protein
LIAGISRKLAQLKNIEACELTKGTIKVPILIKLLHPLNILVAIVAELNKIGSNISKLEQFKHNELISVAELKLNAGIIFKDVHVLNILAIFVELFVLNKGTDFNLPHPENIEFEIITLGITKSIFSNNVHPLNVLLQLTFGEVKVIFIFFNDIHPLNALVAIFVPVVISCKNIILLQPNIKVLKVALPKSVGPLIALNFLQEENVFPGKTPNVFIGAMCTSWKHPAKQLEVLCVVPILGSGYTALKLTQLVNILPIPKLAPPVPK